MSDTRSGVRDPVEEAAVALWAAGHDRNWSRREIAEALQRAGLLDFVGIPTVPDNTQDYWEDLYRRMSEHSCCFDAEDITRIKGLRTSHDDLEREILDLRESTLALLLVLEKHGPHDE